MSPIRAAVPLDALSDMLVASSGDQRVDLAWVTERAGALGPFIRSLVGLDRAAAAEAFGAFLYESPYVDHGHVDVIFPSDFEVIVDILRDVSAHAMPSGVA